jgi:hypothetical protein
MTPSIQQAVEEIRSAYPGHSVDVEDDGAGGAFVKVHDLLIGDQYVPPVSWIAFRITFQYPLADVYGHYCVPNLARRDNVPLGQGFSQQVWRGEPATMMSRRSNHLNPALDTAAFKLAKVLDWMRSL